MGIQSTWAYQLLHSSNEAHMASQQDSTGSRESPGNASETEGGLSEETLAWWTAQEETFNPTRHQEVNYDILKELPFESFVTLHGTIEGGIGEADDTFEVFVLDLNGSEEEPVLVGRLFQYSSEALRIGDEVTIFAVTFGPFEDEPPSVAALAITFCQRHPRRAGHRAPLSLSTLAN